MVLMFEMDKESLLIVSGGKRETHGRERTAFQPLELEWNEKEKEKKKENGNGSRKVEEDEVY